ncbi:MAG: winged helix-turn-helix domain-containing protein [Methanobacteriaceae archaeon]
MQKALWWMILGAKGGLNRAKLIKILKERPHNAHQLSKILEVNYRTIRHHMDILEKSKIVKSTEQKYGKVYYLSERMESNYSEFEDIWSQING